MQYLTLWVGLLGITSTVPPIVVGLLGIIAMLWEGLLGSTVPNIVGGPWGGGGCWVVQYLRLWVVCDIVGTWPNAQILVSSFVLLWLHAMFYYIISNIVLVLNNYLRNIYCLTGWEIRIHLPAGTLNMFQVFQSTKLSLPLLVLLVISAQRYVFNLGNRIQIWFDYI